MEVYKGPLSQEPPIQWGELIGYLEEAQQALVANTNFTLAVVQNKDFASLRGKGVDHLEINYLTAPPTNTPGVLYQPKITPLPPNSFHISWCDDLDPEGFWDQLDYFDCIILRSLYTDSLDLIREVNYLVTLLHTHRAQQPAPNKLDPNNTELILEEVAKFSSSLRAKGFRWAVSTTAAQSFNVKVRIALLNFVATASEFGNQLQARADTLMKQFYGTGHDRRELALSSHLRETTPTDFVHLYDWLGGSTDAFRYNLPEFLLTGIWPASTGERVKIVNRLFADHFWSRINTVYASGKGKVGMAFVKDDLGNWNLKNFDNAPGELLDAYMQLGTTMVKKAGELALAVNTAGGSEAATLAIQGLVKGAQQVQDSIQATPNISAEARSRLKALDEKTATALNKLTTEREKQDSELSDTLSKAPLADQSAIQDKILLHRQETIAEAETILTSYKQQVELLDKAAASISSDKPGVSLPPTQGSSNK